MCVVYIARDNSCLTGKIRVSGRKTVNYHDIVHACIVHVHVHVLLHVLQLLYMYERERCVCYVYSKSCLTGKIRVSRRVLIIVK